MGNREGSADWKLVMEVMVLPCVRGTYQPNCFAHFRLREVQNLLFMIQLLPEVLLHRCIISFIAPFMNINKIIHGEKKSDMDAKMNYGTVRPWVKSA